MSTLTLDKATRGARPIRDKEVLEYYNKHIYRDVSIAEYTNIFKNWIEYTNNKSISGLDLFPHTDYTQGTSQTFDSFIFRHSQHRTIITLPGEFQYHACLGKHAQFEIKDFHNHDSFLGPDLYALIISAPFSDTGTIHPEFEYIMEMCESYNIPVCLDLAYWGIGKHVHIELEKYPAIKEITCSLSKPFYTLENHRVGIRFTKEYADDGISMINEVHMQNKYSMSLGAYMMKKFSPDYMWEKYCDEHYHVCNQLGIYLSDTVIFGISTDIDHNSFNRGLPGNNRICISEYMSEI